MSINRPVSQNQYSAQDVINSSLDQDFGVSVVEMLGFDGTNLQRQITPNTATKITTSGSIVYVGIAPPGTAQATAGWQAKKIDSTDANNVVITWADGDTNFDNVATDLSGLSYS
jgi:hypothetical protein